MNVSFRRDAHGRVPHQNWPRPAREEGDLRCTLPELIADVKEEGEALLYRDPGTMPEGGTVGAFGLRLSWNLEGLSEQALTQACTKPYAR